MLAVAALAVALARMGTAFSAPAWAILGLCALAVVAERQCVRIGPHTQMSVAALPILFAAVVFGPYAAMVVGASSVLLDFKAPYTRWVVWTTSRALAGGGAGLVVLLLPLDDAGFTRTLVAVAAAALTEALLDLTFNSLTVAVRRSGSFRETARTMGPLLLSTLPLYTPVVAALAYAYEELSPWSVLLFFVPAAAAQRLLALYQEQRELAQDLGAANTRLGRVNVSFASALVAAVDARDHYTAGHSAAVAVYARDIAARLGLSPEEQQLAHLCGLLHDIGKVGLPPALLEKAGPLTLEERRLMEGHTVIGERILANVDDYAEIARIVRHHHERIDGNGYPDRLHGDEIPLVARIISVADAYNAMTSGRPYRLAMSSRVARVRLAQAAGSQFDAAVVDAFAEILADSAETYLRGARADFALAAQRHVELVPLRAVASAAT